MKRYPKIRTVGHREVAALLPGDVVIQEKIDGSNFTFGRTNDGKLFCLSRNQVLNLDEDCGMFQTAVDYVKSIDDKIPPATMFRCEYLRTPTHNVIKYDRVPLNHLVLFEAEQQNIYGDWILTGCSGELILIEWARRLDIEPVRFFFRGMLEPQNVLSVFEDCMGHESQLGGTKPEGIVIKNPSAFTDSGDICRAKLVRQEFKEIMAHNKKNPSDGGDPSSLGHRFGGEPRWRKAIQHLRDEGRLKEGPEDIGPLMKEIQRDVEVECIDEIKEALWKRYKKDILNGACHGFVEWYKKEIGLLQ
jgi:hypothetical protein